MDIIMTEPVDEGNEAVAPGMVQEWRCICMKRRDEDGPVRGRRRSDTTCRVRIVGGDDGRTAS